MLSTRILAKSLILSVFGLAGPAAAIAQNGPILWSDTFGGGSFDYGTSVEVAPDGTVWTMASVDGPGSSSEVSIRRYDEGGALLSEEQFRPGNWVTAPFEMVLDGSGGAYLGGWDRGHHTLPMNVFLCRLDGMGRPLWTRIFGSAGSDQVHGIAPDGQGGVFLGGFFFGALGSISGNEDAYVARFDSLGNELWSRTFGTSRYDVVEDCVADGAGGVIAAGSTRGQFAGPQQGFQHGFAVHFNSLGLETWRTAFGSSGHDSVLKATSDRRGGCYIAGITNGDFAAPLTGEADLFVLRINAAGQELWRRQMGAPGHAGGQASITTTPEGGCLVVMSSTTALAGPVINGTDLHMIRFDENGATVGQRVLGGPYADGIGEAAYDRDGTLLLCGHARSPLFGPTYGAADAFVARIAADGIGGTICTPAAPNSTGTGAFLRVYGSAFVDDDALQLRVQHLPASTFGFFVVSGQSSAPITPPGSAGCLCLGGSIGRFVGPGQILNSGTGGSFALEVQPSVLPSPTGSVSATAGQAWFFQAWYRDIVGATSSDFSSAATVTFR